MPDDVAQLLLNIFAIFLIPNEQTDGLLRDIVSLRGENFQGFLQLTLAAGVFPLGLGFAYALAERLFWGINAPPALYFGVMVFLILGGILAFFSLPDLARSLVPYYIASLIVMERISIFSISFVIGRVAGERIPYVTFVALGIALALSSYVSISAPAIHPTIVLLGSLALYGGSIFLFVSFIQFKMFEAGYFRMNLAMIIGVVVIMVASQVLAAHHRAQWAEIVQILSITLPAGLLIGLVVGIRSR